MNNEEQDLGLFLGSQSSYESYKRKNKIKDEEDIAKERETKSLGTSKKQVKRDVLSLNTLKPISDDMFKILKRTITLNDYENIHMQSALDFYDEFYNETGLSEELKAARNIKFMYRNYHEYLNAVRIRDAYLDTLVDKYGGEDAFMTKATMGMIKDWIPPMPVLSKTSEDYEMYKAGIVPMPELPGNPEKGIEVLESMYEEIKDKEPIIEDHVMDRIGEIRYIEENLYENDAYYYRHDSDTSDLTQLNKIFKSWYKPENESTKHELFRNAPENIRKRYLEWRPYNEAGLLARIGKGEEIEEPKPNPNEMVNDPVTGRVMTRRELESRETIRFLAKTGGWSESRLLNYQNVGSSLERAVRRKKTSKKRRNAKMSSELYDDMEMNSPSGIDPIYSDNDSLIYELNSLMGGD